MIDVCATYVQIKMLLLIGPQCLLALPAVGSESEQLMSLLFFVNCILFLKTYAFDLWPVTISYHAMLK